MSQVVIENPVINSPFEIPRRHFRFTDEGITSEIVEERRKSAYFIPVPQPKKKTQATLDLWGHERREENHFINQIRDRVAKWRGDYAGVTPTTRRLLQYWQSEDREKRFFFCQIEALETAIYITEAASKLGDHFVVNELRNRNAEANPLLYRMAFKMATGSGKTVVMAMLIAWQALNKFANPQDSRFSDAFLIVSPGITIRDRLRVLLPSDPDNYYRQRDILPPDLLAQLGKAKIVITNYHAFQRRELVDASKLAKEILAKDGNTEAFKETPEQMVRRVCRELGNKRNIVVINDEAHHCCREKPVSEEETLRGEDKTEAEKNREAARTWISGIEAVKEKIGVKVVFDLSATPFFLKGSGYREGTLFPWVVSDFSLIDAIESGIVKVPRMPVADDSTSGDMPTYRNLWVRIRDQLPKRGRSSGDTNIDPVLPKELEGALHSLYSNYVKYFERWSKDGEAQNKGQTPPVMIVVCNNTSVSKLVYDYIAGWETGATHEDGSPVVASGNLELFSNAKDGRWLARPNTILIDSEQLESGSAMSDEFKKIAKREIEDFKNEYRTRFPGANADAITDEDLMREVMNTVGKPGKLGEQVRCVVSVSMLTEGWDANTVTHILGVRAFSTQLLCEQVVGRGLRRMSYAVNDQGRFDPEYAEVYGVPFSFIPTAGSGIGPIKRPVFTRVRALDERKNCEIRFPRVIGYRWDMPKERIQADLSMIPKMRLTHAQIPTTVELDPIVGESSIHTLDELKSRREQEVAFVLAKRILTRYFRDASHGERFWLFPQFLKIAKEWMTHYVEYVDDTFPQLLLLSEHSHFVAEQLYKCIIMSTEGEKKVQAIFHPYEPVGTTRVVDFDTAKPTFATSPNKCHVSHVVADTNSWEQSAAFALEHMDEVVSYVKNEKLNFVIPYSYEGSERSYLPDFIVRIDDGHGHDDLLNLVVEVSGYRKRDKDAKATTMKSLWIPAINNHGGFGRWDFVEVTDVEHIKTTIREAVKRHSETYQQVV
ncbi:BPTD_3080 family restriction endonuclease [Alicyclobacillus suci]|uniref:BPTD_3080 family restriction endonuclease n=1 Tax=Alicyclobacillus suci TaxID=2816080 RepID=UPI001A8D55C8|nr:DEAD/DEAH box helicase family protein [Alicyclobacillus suci]